MNLNNILTNAELESISNPIKDKLSIILKDLTNKIENDNNLIEKLKELLRNENQKFLELEMALFKDKISGNKIDSNKDSSRDKDNNNDITIKDNNNDINTARDINITNIKGNKNVNSKAIFLLRKKISFLKNKNLEFKEKEESLNSQIEFLTQNYDKDSKELCKMIGEYLNEINQLKRQIKENYDESLVKIKEELRNLRNQEKEYQNYIYLKVSELHKLNSEMIELKSRGFREEKDSNSLKRLILVKENINKKNILIGKMGMLIEKYRNMFNKMLNKY